MRPSIYIGLGGTGIRILAAIKKQYEDVYGKGNIPPIVNFLAIDYYLAEIKNPELSTSIEEDALLIPYIGSPREHFEAQEKRGAYNWLFPGNTDSLAHRISDGAGQVRTTGRFYTEYLLPYIQPALQQRVQQVQQIAFAPEIDIYMLTSLCGGTGAGSFINMADLVRSMYGNRCNIIGYGVLHSVFRMWDPLRTHTRRFPLNAYSATLDLDYLMSATPSKPVKFTINGEEKSYNRPLFDHFYLIDNQTESGRITPNIKELCPTIGLHIYTRSQIPMPESPHMGWQSGRYNLADKKGWVSGMGVMRVAYRGDLLAKIYGCKAAVELIRKMRQEGSDIPLRAIDWTVTAKVREDEGNDLLIDSIYSVEALGKLRGPKVTIQDSVLEIHNEVRNYINTLVDFPEKKALAELQVEKERLLKAELVSILSGDGGVGNAQKFLKVLTLQLDICRSEMEAEAAVMKQQLADMSSVLAKAQQEYDNYGSIFFIRTNRGRQERLDVVSETAKGMLKLALEIKRREAARDIFVHLLNEIQKYHHQLASTDALLGHLSELYTNESDALIHQVSPLYEHDLSVLERENVTINPNEIRVAQFVATMDKSLLDLDIETELQTAIDGYVAQLPPAEAYRTKPIAEVIEAMSNEALTGLAEVIGTKAERLLRLNNRGLANGSGQRPTELIANHSHLCFGQSTPRNAHLITQQLATQLPCGITEQYDCSGIGPQEMVMFHTWEAVIPYCIEAFDQQDVEAYERVIESYSKGEGTFNPHFDKVLFDQMRQEGFSLKPRSASEEPEQ
ncbi:MAG: hypothetical protein IIX78_03840 [Alistipes sp.]|nr:hypothetical protein [Alistipes sp.]